MMDSERSHRSNSSTTGDLLICFTSRFSSSYSNNSSSMKISSKSILSPGRTDKFREPQISLSSSLSRRLRSNGSMKGGQASPMFPAAGKKRGCGFENPEPSSPKVTCIGQVRVKTKKQGKKMRSRSKRRGEVSFRKIEQHTVEGGVIHQGHGHHLQTQQECLPHHRNQRWVHLPLTICEALRAFGADFNCFLPCRSSCTSGEREKGEKGAGESSGGCASSGSCGAVFARWLVALQDGEKGRDIELVVGDDERAAEGFQRRHVLDDIEIKLEEDEAKDGGLGGEEARVSICIPPKNALLLMRCRSDPMRMAALANKFWEAPLPQEEEDEEEEEDDEQDEEDSRNDHEQVYMYTDAVVEEQEEGEEEEGEDEEGGDTKTKDELQTAPPRLLDEVLEKRASVGETEEESTTVSGDTTFTTLVATVEEEEAERKPEIFGLQEENQDKKEEEEEAAQGDEGEAEEPVPVPTGFSPDPLLDSETLENEEIELPPQLLEDHEEQEEGDPAFPSNRRHSVSSPPPPVPGHSEPEREDTAAEAEAEALAKDDEVDEVATVERKEPEKSMVSESKEEEEETATPVRPDWDQDRKLQETETDKDDGGQKSNNRKTQPHLKHETKTASAAVAGAGALPDCLLLMMCEPKLSMEVSKETWVCSTDFVRWHPDKQVKQNNGPDQPKTRLSTDSNPSQQQQHHLHQPPRSSCSFPAAAAAGVSMATMIEQKLVNAAAYEPFVLTRCKSEPMRSSAKLAADACCWKNRKLEPHRPRVGAAGVGF